jgi:DNA-binding NtrC family response regulator
MLFEPRGRRLSFGTIYLREPAEMQRELQDVLARMLLASDSGPDEPRIIAGHSRDPAEAVCAGRLLEELHHALTTITISLPPLRERLADLDALIGLLLKRAQPLIEHKVTGVSAEAMPHSEPMPGLETCASSTTSFVRRAHVPQVTRSR